MVNWFVRIYDDDGPGRRSSCSDAAVSGIFSDSVVFSAILTCNQSRRSGKTDSTMKITEYTKLKEAVEREYKEKLHALDIVFQLSRRYDGVDEPAPATVETNPASSGNGEKAGKGKILQAALAAISQMPGDFGWQDVATKMKELDSALKFKEGSVRQIVRNLAADGDLKTTRKGKSRTPAMYRKP